MWLPSGNRLRERCPEDGSPLEVDLVTVTGQHGIMLYDVTCRTCFWSDQRNTAPLRLHIPETGDVG